MHHQTRQRLRDLTAHFASLVYNLAYFAKRSPEENDLALLRNLVLSLPREVKAKYADECAYVELLSPDELRFVTFPYPEDEGKLGAAGMVISKEKGLFYVLHTARKSFSSPGLKTTT